MTVFCVTRDPRNEISSQKSHTFCDFSWFFVCDAFCDAFCVTLDLRNDLIELNTVFLFYYNPTTSRHAWIYILLRMNHATHIFCFRGGVLKIYARERVCGELEEVFVLRKLPHHSNTIQTKEHYKIFSSQFYLYATIE